MPPYYRHIVVVPAVSVGVIMCTWAGEHNEAIFSIAVRCNVIIYADPPNVVQNFTKVVEECSGYGVDFVQFRHCWDWGSCPLYGMWGVPHFCGFDCTQTYVNTIGTI